MGPYPISNAEFGRRVGLTFSMVSRLRSGERRTSMKVLLRISEEFGLDLKDLAEANVEGGQRLADLLASVAPKMEAPV